MSIIWTGTAAVESGSTTVTVVTGLPLSNANCSDASLVLLNGVAYFVESRTDTLSFTLTRAYAGASETAQLEIWPVSEATTSLVNLATVVARTQAQLNVLDANGRGLFYNLIGVTGPGDPGPGNMAFNHADPAQVTAIYLDVLDANEGGRNVAGLIALLEPGTVLVARSLASSAYASFIVTETPSGIGGFRTLSVAPVLGGADGALSTEPLAIEWRLPGADKDVDGEADTQASRNALFGGEAVGFRVMVRNYLNGRAARTTKIGAAADAWSDPAYWTGANGTPSTVPGPPGITWREAYSAVTTYAINDGVSFNGSSFRKLTTAPAGTAPSSANPPVSTVDWEVTAAKGVDGTGVVQGISPGTGVSVSGTVTNPTVALASIAEGTVLGRAAGTGTGQPSALNGGQVRALSGLTSTDAVQFGSIVASTSQNAATFIAVRNATNDVAAASQVSFGNNGGTDVARVRLNSALATGLIGGANALAIINDFSAPVVIATSGVERVRVTADRLKIGRSADLSGSGNDGLTGADIKSDGTFHSHTSNSPSTYYAKIAGYTNSFFHAYYVNGTLVGSVTTTGSATAFNTTSDYRAKSDVVPLVTFTLDEAGFDLLGPALRRVMLLNPVSHKWLSDPVGPSTHGFIAHEAQAIVPHAVYGVKDGAEDIGMAVVPERVLAEAYLVPEMVVSPAYIVPGAIIIEADPEKGFEEERAPDIEVPAIIVPAFTVPAMIEPERVIENITEVEAPEGAAWAKTGTRPVYQGVDTSKMVADLTASVQELTLMVVDLKRKLAELERP